MSQENFYDIVSIYTKNWVSVHLYCSFHRMCYQSTFCHFFAPLPKNRFLVHIPKNGFLVLHALIFITSGTRVMFFQFLPLYNWKYYLCIYSKIIFWCSNREIFKIGGTQELLWFFFIFPKIRFLSINSANFDNNWY